MGERAGNANLGEVALTLRALYGVESNLRLDRIRAVSARVRELSGYELEPWKPVTGETLYRRESRRGRDAVPRPAVDRAVLVGARRDRAVDRARQEERARLDPHQGGRARARRAGGAARRGARGGEEARHREARARHRRRVSGSLLAEYDAVVVGSGVNGLACAALLAKAGWNVCVLERNDWFGGAIKTAEITAPGFRHDVFSAWHPLWVGGPAHAQLGDDLARHGLEYLNTELPTATLLPGRRERVPAAHGRGERGRAGRASGTRVLATFFPNADLAFGVLGTELWSRHGAALVARLYRRLGRDGARDFTGNLLISARDWLETTFASERAHGLLAPWVLHTGLGPTRRRPATWRR